MDSSDSRAKVCLELIAQLTALAGSMDIESELRSVVTQTISHVNSMDSESEFKQVIAKIISLRDSMDLNTETKLKPLFVQTLRFIQNAKTEPVLKLTSLLTQIANLNQNTTVEPERESESKLFVLCTQILSILLHMMPEQKKLPISLYPRVAVKFENGKFHAAEPYPMFALANGCKHRYQLFYNVPGEDATHFNCSNCNGEFHEDHEQAPLEVKHPLHPKHSLQLVYTRAYPGYIQCYGCGKDLDSVFYYCSTCNCHIDIACLDKQPLLAIDHPKWHEHTLSLFPRQTSLTCNVCALSDSTTCPFYLCSPCDFVVHKNCLSLPRVIRISRHPHRISFTHSFAPGDLVCGICRTKVDNDYGGYSCTKDNCSYAAHSRCATQTNVWDGIDLEGVSEEIEEVLEPFVRISDGIIQHFCHENHHLKLDENTNGEYDENKECQACITPIYFGKFYSCMKCDFIFHEECANLPRKMYHPLHAHKLILEVDDSGTISTLISCSACQRICSGLVYFCSEENCKFKLDLGCATISEPLVHESHIHHLFLTSKPDEQRTCKVCKELPNSYTTETFNCIECDFSSCFKCATLPQKVRYKHDKHILSLSYGKEASVGTQWCEICETVIDPLSQRFYMCDESCCVTVHVKCMFQVEYYMKVGSSVMHFNRKLDVVRNNHMSRPICVVCKKRCQHKVYFRSGEKIACSIYCVKPWIQFRGKVAEVGRPLR